MSRALPSGTVTLLFTDIEGSSTLWDDHRSEMALALTKHNELVSEAIAGHGGHVVKDKGDGYFAVFPAAEGAIAACVDAASTLSAPWRRPTGRNRSAGSKYGWPSTPDRSSPTATTIAAPW
jgi:class 3 adenylate cyclase